MSALLFGLRALHYRGLLRQDQGFYGKFKTAFLASNHYDLLFLGSSRVEMHYDPKIIDSVCGSNSFNLGVKGATPRVALAVLKAYLVNSKAPARIVYDVDYHFLKYKSEEVKEFNNYFPFLSNPVLLDEFSQIDPRMRHFHYNPYYSWPYTGLKNISTSLHGWLGISNKTDSLYYKGHLRESFMPPLGVKTVTPYLSWIHPEEGAYLDSLIAFCGNKAIRLHFVSSAMFGGGKVDLLNKEGITAQLRARLKKQGFRYYDLSSLPFCNERALFVDHFHLNRHGAREFSLYFARFFNNNLAGSPLK